jgi:hypothetical protein
MKAGCGQICRSLARMSSMCTTWALGKDTSGSQAFPLSPWKIWKKSAWNKISNKVFLQPAMEIGRADDRAVGKKYEILEQNMG